ncbi:type I restriction enzyme HsdR N-terminal domain-containing protein [Paenactinomyces guangxiensis]|uniref:type I restriction enzyme HsdR N-terminal domain-containing protein n=1 Tax=Paenactinomyces guangxiensis TaxID=1490290 RepID=UPI0018DB3564|nr:type I restriction enzyme HsdR N-terminal domain-containing protein [Paenactinomyces guangxiensis]MBH8593452.1 type I restriction enzyme HsdR N-terminal domain-containing protein [Paenactinomyces guangxiensis]
MSEMNEDSMQAPSEGTGEETVENFFIDILTGEKVKESPKKLLIQKVLRTLIESYGFDRSDLEVNYNPRIPGHRQKRIDIAIFRSGREHINENLERIIICRNQTSQDRLRTFSEADHDLEQLRELMRLLQAVDFGMWTNGQEEFILQAEHTRFEVRLKPIAIWPVPGEQLGDLNRTGGIIQVSVEAEDLKEALMRCHRYLNRNLGLDHKDAFKQLAVLLLAKIFDETRPPHERNFWIRSDEPYTIEGQQEIQRRIEACIRESRNWQPNLLTLGWNLELEPQHTARVVMELARYSLSETQPRYRTQAFRAIVRSVMDGREGRYPTPLNVAEMAVQMLNPQLRNVYSIVQAVQGLF